MYSEKKFDVILSDLENKEIEMGGGSIIGIVLATTNSLIKYISNLTIGKKKYEDVEQQVKEILEKAEELKIYMLQLIDKDKEILENILEKYKTRKERKEEYENACKEAVELGIEVTKKSLDTLKLVKDISLVGNIMLISDFEIAMYYTYASIEASIVNIKINLNSLESKEYIDRVNSIIEDIFKEADNLKSEIIKIKCSRMC